jgi:hypothetical protein
MLRSALGVVIACLVVVTLATLTSATRAADKDKELFDGKTTE